jgi:hypothetical protein
LESRFPQPEVKEESGAPRKSVAPKLDYEDVEGFKEAKKKGEDN